jgi:signal peptidase
MLGITCVGLLLAVGIGPRTGRYRTLTVLSGSMRPGIPVGAVVVVTPERPDQLRAGQIVTYQIPVDDHRVVTHRVVSVTAAGDHPVFKTKGDANTAPDAWLAQVDDTTVWRVRYVAPRLGLLLHWLRTPLVHTVTVILIPMAIALAWIVGIWRDDRGVGAGTPA